VVAIAEASEAWLGKQGYGPEEEIDPEGDDAQAVLQQASLLGQAALGPRAGRRARRVQLVGGRKVDLPPRCAAFEGYNLHAGVGLGARERDALERLCRYLLRPPLARDRLQRHPDGTVEVGPPDRACSAPGVTGPVRCSFHRWSWSSGWPRSCRRRG
jgi:hypothetical protein